MRFTVIVAAIVTANSEGAVVDAADAVEMDTVGEDHSEVAIMGIADVVVVDLEEEEEPKAPHENLKEAISPNWWTPLPTDLLRPRLSFCLSL